MPEQRWDSFSEPGGIILLAVLLGGVPLFFGWRALSGSWRSWVLNPPAGKQISRRNLWPFSLLCWGLIGLVVSGGLAVEQLGYDEVKDFLWDVALWIPMAAMLLSLFWWPTWLAPKWYRTWCAAGGTRDVMPFTPEDVDRIEAMPEGRRRRRYARNLTVCLGRFVG